MVYIKSQLVETWFQMSSCSRFVYYYYYFFDFYHHSLITIWCSINIYKSPFVEKHRCLLPAASPYREAVFPTENAPLILKDAYSDCSGCPGSLIQAFSATYYQILLTCNAWNWIWDLQHARGTIPFIQLSAYLKLLATWINEIVPYLTLCLFICLSI